MKKYYFGLIWILILTSCTNSQVESHNISLEEIQILTQGNSIEDSDDMREICQSFQLTKEQVRLYYFESRNSTEAEIHDNFNILPCNSTGTISINGEAYSWIIRAGGVGSFYNEQQTILRVCDEACCKLTKEIC